MDSWQWMEILRKCPEKAEECSCWDEFTPAEFWNNEEKCPDCTPAKP